VPEDADNDLQRLERALAACQDLQELAYKYGINDIFQDNGGKVLQTLIVLGLKSKPGREGNDAVDDEGNEYELKTVNTALGKSRGITTHHHLNLTILAKYRQVKAWYIALYDGIILQEIFRIEPIDLKEVFDGWEKRLNETEDRPINNPKIPMRVVRKGKTVYPTETPQQAQLLPPSSPVRDDVEN